MNDYLGIDALKADRSLAQIAMIDELRVKNQNMVQISFDTRHPYNNMKEQRFARRT